MNSGYSFAAGWIKADNGRVNYRPEYDIHDAEHVVNWLLERNAGYPTPRTLLHLVELQP